MFASGGAPCFYRRTISLQTLTCKSVTRAHMDPCRTRDAYVRWVCKWGGLCPQPPSLPFYAVQQPSTATSKNSNSKKSAATAKTKTHTHPAPRRHAAATKKKQPLQNTSCWATQCRKKFGENRLQFRGVRRSTTSVVASTHPGCHMKQPVGSASRCQI